MPDGSAVSKKTKAGPISGRPAEELCRAHREARRKSARRWAAICAMSTARPRGVGYDVKTMRKIVSLRKMDAG